MREQHADGALGQAQPRRPPAAPSPSSYLVHRLRLDLFGLLFNLDRFDLLGEFFLWLRAFKPLHVGPGEVVKNRPGTNERMKTGTDEKKTYFTFKELVVGGDELVFFRRFGNIFNTSQKFVLVQELGKKKMRLDRETLTSRIVTSLPASRGVPREAE